MSISKYLPIEHPTRRVFKKHGVPLSAISNFTGLTYNYTSSLLRSAISATPAVDEKLHEFAKMVEQLEKGGTK